MAASSGKQTLTSGAANGCNEPKAHDAASCTNVGYTEVNGDVSALGMRSAIERGDENA